MSSIRFVDGIVGNLGALLRDGTHAGDDEDISIDIAAEDPLRNDGMDIEGEDAAGPSRLLSSGGHM